jgi:cell volume regulation protein A
MFTLLGLLSTPSRLLAANQPALLVAGMLVFVARPLTVVLCLLPFRYTLREMTFVAWGGLKGSVPIILATYPLMTGVAGAQGIFDIVFFAVLVSAVTQGWTLPYAARALGLQERGAPEAGVTLEISSLQDVEGDIVEFTAGEGARATGARIRELALPDGVVVAMIVRGRQIIPPRGSTQILPGDHIFVLLKPAVREIVERVLAVPGEETWSPAVAMEFPLRGTTRLGEIEEFYGIHIDAPVTQTLDEFLRAGLGRPPEPGDTLISGPLTFIVRELVEGQIETVGLVLEVGL